MRLVLKNARVLNVFTEELLPADVLVENGKILGVGCYDAPATYDCAGRILCPGFIDTHVHIESSMITPLEFAKTIVRSGTTSIVADPHEIVNVAGSAGFSYMLDASEQLPISVYLMLPSSVPATAFETNGGSFTAQEMAQFVGHPRVLGLGEVMCYPDVLANAAHITDKLALCRAFMIDGHAPGLTGDDLQRYCAAGVQTDHECTNFAEALEKRRAGMQILIREGSGAKNLRPLVTGLLESGLPTNGFLFCTDDKHPEDIRQQGHIRWNIHEAIACGMAPIQALLMATYRAATAYHMPHKGAIASGYDADFVLLDSLEEVSVCAVWQAGRLIDEPLLASFRAAPIPAALRDSVRFESVTPDRLRLIRGAENTVIENIPYQLLTRRLREALPGEGTDFVPNECYSKLCVVERHQATGNVAVAPVKGFGLREGAIATTVAHDSHNVIAIGDNDADLCLAINHTKAIGGGYVVVQGGKLLDCLPLSVGGLMSDQPDTFVIDKIAALVRLVHEMGVPTSIEPFITLSFMALPVIPEIRLTDRGLFDVARFCLE